MLLHQRLIRCACGMTAGLALLPLLILTGLNPVGAVILAALAGTVFTAWLLSADED